VTPRKLAVIADEVRGKSVASAMNYLALSPRRRVAALISGVLKSAVANAEQKGTMDLDQLVISKILVSKGPTLKRFKARAKGSASRILKYSCHLKVFVAEDTSVAKKAAKKAAKTAAKKKTNSASVKPSVKRNAQIKE
jgi:large subunit ribosomal protein L22